MAGGAGLVAGGPRRVAGGPRQRAVSAAGRVARAARRHWLFTSVFVIGIALRVAVQIAYWPALLYIDSVRYLYAESNWDPLGYLIVLWPLLRIGGLALVSVAQHMLGLSMAAGIYAVALRRGARRWVGALAAVPVLLDAYQLQIEQNILADTLFEAVVVAFLAMLLWNNHLRVRTVAIAGLALGTAAIVREVGVLLVGPAAVYVWLAARAQRHLSAQRPAPGRRTSLLWRSGRIWRRPIAHSALLCAGFALPVVGYLVVNYAATGRMELAGQGSNLYGRAAAAANCATLQIRSDEATLCPTPSTARALGVDGLVHDRHSPAYTFTAPPGTSSRELRGDFTRQVFLQQPGTVATAITEDIVGSFSYPRAPGQADTPIFRWQFQTSYPAFPARLTHPREARIMRQFGGGKPTVVRPLATALRVYQLDGGYTPGPALALAGLIGIAGMAGSDRLWRRRTRRIMRLGGRGISPGGAGRRAGGAGIDPDGAGRRPVLADAREMTGFGDRNSGGGRTWRDGPARIDLASGTGGRGGAGGAALAVSAGRDRPASAHPAGLRAACFLVIATGLALLVGADIVEFSWRYQLPGLVTLPLAGALGLTVLTSRSRRRPSRGSRVDARLIPGSRREADVTPDIKPPEGAKTP